MKFEIEIKEEVSQNQFNFYLHNNYEIFSIVPYNGIISISANITEIEKTEIEDYYSLLDSNFVLDTEYFESFLIDKYKINSETGKEFVFKITAKLNVLIQSATVTIEQAENYGLGTGNVITELERGYFHSAYFKLIEFTPITELAQLHEEVRIYIKDYVNTKYPPNFSIA